MSKDATPERTASELICRAQSFFHDMRDAGSADRSELWRELKAEFVSALAAAEARGAEREREKWARLDLCGVCGGAPLASGRPCVCGGKGTADAERLGLRLYALELEKRPKRAYLSEVFRIVEGMMRADFDKVDAYARLLADKLEEDGEENSARWLRQILDGNAGARIVPLAADSLCSEVKTDGL